MKRSETTARSFPGGRGAWILALLSLLIGGAVVAQDKPEKKAPPKDKFAQYDHYKTTLAYESVGVAQEKFVADSVELRRILEYYSKANGILYRITANDGKNGPANDKPDDFAIQMISDTWRKVYEIEEDAERNQGNIGYRGVIKKGMNMAITRFKKYITGGNGIITIREEYRKLPKDNSLVTADKSVWVEIRGKDREYFLAESYVDEKTDAIKVPHRFIARGKNDKGKWYNIKISFDFSKETQANLSSNPVKFAVDTIKTRNIVLRENQTKVQTNNLGNQLNW